MNINKLDCELYAGIYRDTLHKLHDACGAQLRGSIALLECNGHSGEGMRGTGGHL